MRETEQSLELPTALGAKVLVQESGKGHPTLVGQIITVGPGESMVVRAVNGTVREYKVPARLADVGFSASRRGNLRFFMVPMSPLAREAYLGFALPDEVHQLEQEKEEA